jgi:protein tyrosine phosphatase
VGRSGTYIAVDMLMDCVEVRHAAPLLCLAGQPHPHGRCAVGACVPQRRSPVNIAATVLQMRKHRSHMVQTDSQYLFIHKALHHLLELSVKR